MPRRIDWRVMIPNQISIWLIHDEPIGVKWKLTFGFCSSHALTSGVVWVDRLSSTTWMSLPACGLTAFSQERQEVGAVAGGCALAEHLAGAHVQRGEQVRRAVAHVVVGALLGHVEGDRQQWLGPVQRLDAGLLIDREHHRTAGRVQVQPDDVGDLLGERRFLLTLNVPCRCGLIRSSRHSFAT